MSLSVNRGLPLSFRTAHKRDTKRKEIMTREWPSMATRVNRDHNRIPEAAPGERRWAHAALRGRTLRRGSRRRAEGVGRVVLGRASPKVYGRVHVVHNLIDADGRTRGVGTSVSPSASGRISASRQEERRARARRAGGAPGTLRGHREEERPAVQAGAGNIPAPRRRSGRADHRSRLRGLSEGDWEWRSERRIGAAL